MVRDDGNSGTKPAEVEAEVPLGIRWCRGGYGGLVEFFERAEYGGGGGVAEDETGAKVSESEMEMQVIVRREVKIRVVGLWKILASLMDNSLDGILMAPFITQYNSALTRPLGAGTFVRCSSESPLSLADDVGNVLKEVSQGATKIPSRTRVVLLRKRKGKSVFDWGWLQLSLFESSS
ncbi:hypothetical protein PIB30_050169 [Stylosanthes scabra]|uniref:Uncharacterized protein n=1 Tax=Stylosanthes scabra TaxID=79078 RepID=A0ABU6QHS9_9FABA|nr:hypothetical protein [Stylosanthes scabra]